MKTAEQIKSLHQRVDTLYDCLHIQDKRAEASQKEARSQEADFWNDPKAAESFLKELSGLKSWLTA